jgi:hypothetical protein
MNTMRKLGLAVVTALVGLGALGLTAPAHAANDTTWGCGGCAHAKP